MPSNAKKFIIGILFLSTCNTARAQSANNDYESALRDSTNWKEYRAMPPMPVPERTPYDDNRLRKLINFLYARAMADRTNWKEYHAMPPMQPEKVEKLHVLQNAKTR